MAEVHAEAFGARSAFFKARFRGIADCQVLGREGRMDVVEGGGARGGEDQSIGEPHSCSGIGVEDRARCLRVSSWGERLVGRAPDGEDGQSAMDLKFDDGDVDDRQKIRNTGRFSRANLWRATR
ncbi:hypothetical protein Tdes44962_MAKER09549 [Teratosphaeria destructans]|uniref:Uncharacterized protein n=1 Tax=Teratosphaeria destructans TaxID=418781 RepID=A0A9W7SST6_9PEZI|nr:hypothetical protein Tdes44962_MAKER09549 [Teratosphaeria destructans]